jgi:predicted ArsR family transcriptional regulator
MSALGRRPAAAGARALQALASPVRQEIITAFADGPLTVKDLAQRLGRTRQALHYHVEQLVRAGILRAAGTRPAGRRQEALYEVTSDTVSGAARRSRRELALAERAAGALLRLTERELRAAIRAGRGAASEGAVREVVAARAKCRLDAAGLARLNGLFDEIVTVLRQAEPRADAPTYAVTLVLTPARDAALARGKPWRS